VFVSSGGSPYARFRRALDTGNLAIVRAAAAELPRVELDDALRVCLLVRDQDQERYEQAAVRWLARFCLERPAAALGDVVEAATAFERMAREPQAGLEQLQAVWARV
jgi:hypothetical protein